MRSRCRRFLFGYPLNFHRSPFHPDSTSLVRRTSESLPPGTSHKPVNLPPVIAVTGSLVEVRTFGAGRQRLTLWRSHE